MIKQHTTPCKECPFARKALPGWLGGSPPEVFIGQAHGNFWLPCHCHSKYDDPNWKSDTGKPQCAGAAIYRANVFKRVMLPLITLPRNEGLVFAAPEEFIAHHKGILVAQAKGELLKKRSVADLMLEEYGKIAAGEGFVNLVERNE